MEKRGLLREATEKRGLRSSSSEKALGQADAAIAESFKNKRPSGISTDAAAGLLRARAKQREKAAPAKAAPAEVAAVAGSSSQVAQEMSSVLGASSTERPRRGGRTTLRRPHRPRRRSRGRSAQVRPRLGMRRPRARPRASWLRARSRR